MLFGVTRWDNYFFFKRVTLPVVAAARARLDPLFPGSKKLFFCFFAALGVPGSSALDRKKMGFGRKWGSKSRQKVDKKSSKSRQKVDKKLTKSRQKVVKESTKGRQKVDKKSSKS